MTRHRPARILASVLAIALLAAPAVAYRLVPRGRPVVVAQSFLVVVPAIDWNRLQQRPGRHAERWTLDGTGLNAVTFYGGIKGGMALFREVDRRNRPLPRFSASMLPTDVVQLFESSYRLAGKSALFTIDDVAPARFAGKPGFRLAYGFTREEDGVRRKGEATGAVIDGRLYLITYEAPAIHYFARNLADYRAVVATARVGLVE